MDNFLDTLYLTGYLSEKLSPIKHFRITTIEYYLTCLVFGVILALIAWSLIYDPGLKHSFYYKLFSMVNILKGFVVCETYS